MIEAAILVLCTEGPQYGYELARVLDAEGLVAGQVHPGRLYETLQSLARLGAVVATAETGTGGPDRLRYEITEEGRARLHRWARSLAASTTALTRLSKRIADSEGGEEMGCNCQCNGGRGRGHGEGHGPAREHGTRQDRSVEERLDAIEGLLERLTNA